jgi:hypothetical protein
MSFEGPGSGPTVALERQIACRLSGRFYHSGQATTARDMIFVAGADAEVETQEGVEIETSALAS